MTEVPYPAPIPREQAERVVQSMINMGWRFPLLGPEEYELAIIVAQRKYRLKTWLKELGVTPNHDERRRYIKRLTDEAVRKNRESGE